MDTPKPPALPDPDVIAGPPIAGKAEALAGGPPTPSPPAIPWWASPTLRYTIAAALPTVVMLLKLLHIVDLTGVDLTQVTGYIVSGVAAVGGLIGIVGVVVRRIKAGNNPASTAAPLRLF